MKTALMVIDVQNDYFPNGKMELSDSIPASIQIKKILQHFRNEALPIIHIKHISTRPGSTFFLPDTFGVEFQENVLPTSDEKIIIKHYPNSFRETELNSYLKDNHISKLVITGMMTHMCIDTTVRAAYDLGYECIVVKDCCATKILKIDEDEISAENVHNAFMAALNGVFSKVLTTKLILEMPFK